MDAVLDTTQTMHRVPRMAVPADRRGLPRLRARGRQTGAAQRRARRHAPAVGLLGDPAAADRLAGAGRRRRRPAPPRGPTTRADSAPGPSTLQVLRARGRVHRRAGLPVRPRRPTGSRRRGFLRDLAYRAALAIDNGELYEQRRREVVTMQQHLLPSRLPGVAGLAIAASYTVGDRVLEVGGDFYDVVVRDDGVVARPDRRRLRPRASTRRR